MVVLVTVWPTCTPVALISVTLFEFVTAPFAVVLRTATGAFMPPPTKAPTIVVGRDDAEP